MALPEDYDRFFSLATGAQPYAYQRELGLAAVPPSVVDVPTGSGKTQALLVAWLYSRLIRRAGPRRLVYALPMRTLVEQTEEVARALRARLGLSPDELPIQVLMGGEPPTDWRELPEGDQILVGTIDMLLSRALNRGFGESRFQWPISFGLLNSDCRWVFDEVQLMGPARATSAQLDGLREKLGTVLQCETVWVSATVEGKSLQTVDRPQLGEVLVLAPEDRTGRLAPRLTAAKTVKRIDLGNVRPAVHPRRIARAVEEEHVRGHRTIAVLNTVERAQAVAEALTKTFQDDAGAPRVVLLHSRFRPPDRAARNTEALQEVDPTGPGLIVVATQVIEAGVDISSRVLATEAAPFSSIVQRAGRCNRAGEHTEATLLWLDTGEPAPKEAAPYTVEDVATAREVLSALLGGSAAPEALRRLDVAPEADDHPVLRRRDLVDLFDTAPDLSGMDVDVSSFIRDDDERTVPVFFRSLDGMTDAELSTQPRPDAEEVVGVPIGDVRERKAFVHDHVEGIWMRAIRDDLRPGETLLLDSADGGYDPFRGWDPRLKTPVEVLEPASEEPPEATGDDPISMDRAWMELIDHLRQAQASARELTRALDLERAAATAVESAAALHDIGKAHPVFQETLLSLAEEDERATMATRLWAKSAKRGGHHSRKFFRHELASALALRADGDLPVERDQRDLVNYLVAAHHGRVRLAIRPAPNERAPRDHPRARRFALGIAEGDELPAVTTPLGSTNAVGLDLSCMELGGTDRSWTEAACALRDGLGPFRLAFLEALVCVADWRASG